jgi:hypothetical protein
MLISDIIPGKAEFVVLSIILLIIFSIELMRAIRKIILVFKRKVKD